MSRQVTSSLAISRCGVRSPAYGETEQMLRVSLVCRRAPSTASVWRPTITSTSASEIGIKLGEHITYLSQLTSSCKLLINFTSQALEKVS